LQTGIVSLKVYKSPRPGLGGAVLEHCKKGRGNEYLEREQEMSTVHDGNDAITFVEGGE
jgi:hypothetical protein